MTLAPERLCVNKILREKKTLNRKEHVASVVWVHCCDDSEHRPKSTYIQNPHLNQFGIIAVVKCICAHREK